MPNFQRTTPPVQDESSEFVKKLYVCETPGCGIFHERKAHYCADHTTAADRAETIAEHEKLSASAVK